MWGNKGNPDPERVAHVIQNASANRKSTGISERDARERMIRNGGKGYVPKDK